MSQQRFNPDDPRLTAYLVDELEGQDLGEIEQLLRESEEAREFVEGLRQTAGLLEAEYLAEGEPALEASQRIAVERQISRFWARPWFRATAAASVLFAATGWFIVYSGGFRLIEQARDANAPHTYSLFSVSDTPAAERSPEVLSRLMALGYSGAEAPQSRYYADGEEPAAPDFNTEQYAHVEENSWKLAAEERLSTFSIDVDTASYSNMRRFLKEGMLPPPASVRIEEFINYFRYDDPPPEGDEPFRVTTEVASAPWAPRNRLLRIGIQAKQIEWSQRQPSNLVFLLDVSGSMDSPDKLPLLQKSLRLLVEQLDERDRVAICVYAGASGLVLPSTSCRQSAEVLAALDRLSAGGSTNGGAGIQLAYAQAEENFIEGGLNRVILATDGDFNVGITDQGSLVELIEEKRKSGVFLSVLGFGRGNLKDATMELLADKGNGNFSYIDSLAEAKKVLVSEMGGTLIPVAKDVKIQVEFNPERVQAWRLIGYENRLLAHQDFNDDTKDAGEIGAGHSVTALYELVPPGVPFDAPTVDPSRYQQGGKPSEQAFTDELLFLKLRYKQPDGATSQLLSTPVRDQDKLWHETSNNFRFAAAVAAYALLLRESSYLGDFGYQQVIELAYEARGEDPGGYRAEFLRLVETARRIASGEPLDELRKLGYISDR
ncbi:MAG: VWA domain-containing protein [Planctomycetota bacterium]